MSRDLLTLKLPEKYTEGLVEYREGLDTVPEWPAFATAGWSMKEYRKFTKLYAIESMKYRLAQAIEDNEVSDEEKVEFDKVIQETIQEYNEMNLDFHDKI